MLYCGCRLACSHRRRRATIVSHLVRRRYTGQLGCRAEVGPIGPRADRRAVAAVRSDKEGETTSSMPVGWLLWTSTLWTPFCFWPFHTLAGYVFTRRRRSNRLSTEPALRVI
jgi:hypothetical protein